MKALAVTLLALAAPSQIPKQPAKDLFMHTLKAPGVEVRFVDYHWQPALFEAFEAGASIPEAKRNWVVARVILDDRPLTLGTARVPVGNYGLVLWPNLDGKGMEIEIRHVDMREVYPNLNALAPAPRGETFYRGRAAFEKVSELQPRMDVTLTEGDDRVTLTIRWGDRRQVLEFVR